MSLGSDKYCSRDVPFASISAHMHRQLRKKILTRKAEEGKASLCVWKNIGLRPASEVIGNDSFLRSENYKLHCFDLFVGSGSYGLEALSRGDES